MLIFLYDAADEKSVEKFVKDVQSLPEGKKYRFEVHEIKPVRSLSQNRRYWAIMNQIATHTGHTRDEIDHMFRMDRHNEIVYYPSGRTEKIPRKTSDLDTREFTIVMYNLEQWCEENFPEVRLIDERSMTYERWLEIEDNYHRSQSGF